MIQVWRVFRVFSIMQPSIVVDEDYLRDSILNPLDRTAINTAKGKAYPNSMPPGIGNQLGPRKVEAMIRFIEKLDEVAPGGSLIEVSRAQFPAKPAEGE